MTRPPNTVPLVAVDWNCIQTISRDLDIPRQYHCLVSDAIGFEIAGKSTPDAYQNACQRFGWWAKHNVDRIWLVRPIGQLAQRQRNPGIRIQRRDLIDLCRTERFRTAAIDDTFNWSAYFESTESRPIIEYEMKRSSLMRLCREVASFPLLAAALSDTPAATIGEAVRSSILPDILAQFYPDEQQKGWREAISHAPLNFVFARFAYVMAYYAATGARSAEPGHPNDWDDAQYAVLASYTGHLATFDAGLKECASILFPGVRLVHPTAVAL